MRERIFNSSRGGVHYWISDVPTSQRTLVLLHGLTADHTLFDKQVAAFDGRYDLIVWDAPAHGRSRPYADFTYPHAAEDLAGILDENDVLSAVLVGQSMGGYISQSFLLRYPWRVEAFIGIDTCPYGEGYYSRSDRWWLRQVEWMSRLYPLGILKKAIAQQSAETPYGRENMLAALAPYGKDELCRLMGIGYAGFLEDNRDMSIDCPLLILCGQHDKTGKVRQYCRAWAQTTGAPLVMIKNAAHNANADNPAQVNAEIAAFVDALG